MSEKKPFLLRMDPKVMDALRRWADDDLRSLNGQIEFLLRRALQDAGRLAGGGVSTAARTGAEAGAGSDASAGPGGGTNADTEASPDADR